MQVRIESGQPNGSAAAETPKKRRGSLISIPKTADKMGSSDRTVWRHIRDDPDFPKPIRLSARMTRLDESEVDAWIERRAAK